MKTLFAASILGLAAVAAVAQPASDDNTVTITSNQRVIALPDAPRAMSAQEFGSYTGSYELADGNSIALFTRGGVKYAAVHGQGAHALVAKNDNTFVARDRQLAVTIEKSADGKVSGEVLMALQGGQVADGTAPQRAVSVALR